MSISISALAEPTAVRGLRAFAEAMTAAWTDEVARCRRSARRSGRSRRALHDARRQRPGMADRRSGQHHDPNHGTGKRRHRSRQRPFLLPGFGVKPTGYEAARDAEKAELDRERIRLWYVAATRARELLVLPRLDVAAKASAWISLLDLSLADLPALDLSHLPTEVGPLVPGKTRRRATFSRRKPWRSRNVSGP